MTSNDLKPLAVKIVATVEPDDLFVVEDGYDDLARHWNDATPQNEGRFAGGAEIATFAALVVPFLISFLGDVVKEAAKTELKNELMTLWDKYFNRRANAADATRLQTEVESAIAQSRFSARQKDTLRAGFAKLFEKLKPAN